MKKILILTSIKTGSGHKSSSNAIEKKLRDAGYDTRQLDVFPLMGKRGDFIENIYIPITTRAPYVYYFAERFSEHFPDSVHLTMYAQVKNGLLKEIKDYQPDLIISVQCMFTKAVSRLIKEYRLNIPFYIGVIDLIQPPAVWMDKNADITFVPTDVIRDDYIMKGFDPRRVLTSGFPVRDDIVVLNKPKTVDSHVNILMVNTSTDLKKNIKFVKEVSKLDNVSIKFICGLDKRLYQTLTEMQKKVKFLETFRYMNSF